MNKIKELAVSVGVCAAAAAIVTFILGVLGAPLLLAIAAVIFAINY